MKIKKKIPRASIAFVVAAILVVTAGTALAATLRPDIISEDYKAEFDLDHIDVALVENGKESKDIESKALLSELEGKVQPGRSYKEEIAAKNVSDTPEIVRMIITTYWHNTDDPEGDPDPKKDPGLIELTFNDDEYNKNAWQINDDETTSQRRVFYLKEVLPGNTTSSPVVNKLRVNNKILEDVEETTEQKGNQTIYTYTYAYDGYQICVEADVQSVQTHNPQETIESTWGVRNVTVSGNKVTVK